MLAVPGGIFMLHWAQAVFIPLLLGLMLSCALTPLVDWLQRLRVPRSVGPAQLIVLLVGGAGRAARRDAGVDRARRTST